MLGRAALAFATAIKSGRAALTIGILHAVGYVVVLAAFGEGE